MRRFVLHTALLEEKVGTFSKVDKSERKGVDGASFVLGGKVDLVWTEEVDLAALQDRDE